MTEKENAKLIYRKIKLLGRNFGWKFKGYFLFKKVDNFFFAAKIYAGGKTPGFTGWISFKPYDIDDKFWDVIRLPENKKMPMSFRGEGAFCIRDVLFFRFEHDLPDLDQIEDYITKFLDELDAQIAEQISKTSTIEDYLQLIEESPKDCSAGIIMCHILLEQFDEAMNKIDSFRAQDISSGYGFGKRDFYDLAERHCKSELGVGLPGLAKRFRRLFENKKTTANTA